MGHLHTKMMNRLQAALLEHDFVIQYKKGEIMPADYLSRLASACSNEVSEITEGFDPFQLDLQDLQKADEQLQNMNHFRVHGKWLHPIPKKEANYLQNLAPKLFEDNSKLVWVRLDDYIYPRTALYLPQKYRKLALCEAHNNQFGGHNAALKTYIRISSSYFWPKNLYRRAQPHKDVFPLPTEKVIYKQTTSAAATTHSGQAKHPDTRRPFQTDARCRTTA